MLVVSLALAAVLIAGGGGSDAGTPDTAVSSTAPTVVVATPTSPPAPSVTPVPATQPPLSFELRERIDRLPAKLRTESLLAYNSGALGIEQLQQIVTNYENRNPSVRVGSVISVTDNRLRLEVFTTGEQVEIATIPQTLIRRSDIDIALDDLMPGELVMVVSTEEGATALTIEAFGVAAP